MKFKLNSFRSLSEAISKPFISFQATSRLPGSLEVLSLKSHFSNDPVYRFTGSLENVDNVKVDNVKVDNVLATSIFLCFQEFSQPKNRKDKGGLGDDASLHLTLASESGCGHMVHKQPQALKLKYSLWELLQITLVKFAGITNLTLLFQKMEKR